MGDAAENRQQELLEQEQEPNSEREREREGKGERQWQSERDRERNKCWYKQSKGDSSFCLAEKEQREREGVEDRPRKIQRNIEN